MEHLPKDLSLIPRRGSIFVREELTALVKENSKEDVAFNQVRIEAEQRLR